VALAAFLRIRRPRSFPEQPAERAYAARIQHVGNRLRTMFDEWLELREVESDYAELANAAAVNRWELLRLARDFQAQDPPRSLAGEHRQVQGALIDAARACQLLANGYRFHKSDAICDGQALLLEMVANLSELAAQLETRS
jgi:hypothetical protein